MNERYSPERLWRAYRHCWFVVARSCDITTPQRAKLLDQQLVVFRDNNGMARVTDRRCIHRGADLSMGKVTEKGIQCPYHGWAFSGESGECSEIPALCDGATIPGNAKILSYPVIERFEHVWTCLDEPLMDVPNPPELDGAEWTWLPAAPIPAKCGFMAATENFRDMAHFPFVHSVSMGEVSPLVPKLEVVRDGRRLGASFRYERVEGSTFSDIGDAWMHYHSYAPGFAAILYEYDTAGKRYLVDFPTPVSHGECIIHWAVAVDKDFKGGTVQQILDIETQVFDEDTPVLEGLNPPEVPLAGQAFEVSCAADVYTLNYRRAAMYVVDHILDTLDARDAARIKATEV